MNLPEQANSTGRLPGLKSNPQPTCCEAPALTTATTAALGENISEVCVALPVKQTSSKNSEKTKQKLEQIII